MITKFWHEVSPSTTDWGHKQTMVLRHIETFLHKSWDERFATARYFFRQGLAKIPYAPMPIRMRMSDEEKIEFWWSYVVPYFDPDRHFFDYWGHDLGELRFLWQSLKPGMVFLDIGAHHGIFSIVAARRMGAHGTVVAFEPSPREYQRLCLHLRLNRMRSVRTEPLALGSSNCTRQFFQVTSGDTTRGGLQSPASPDLVSTVTVNAAQLDDYVSQFPMERVDIVKLDVEGAEREVLEGASHVLTVLRPALICEVLDATTQVWGYRAREIVRALQDCNYNWFEFRSDGSTVPHQMKEHYPDVQNYLAMPRERCS